VIGGTWQSVATVLRSRREPWLLLLSCAPSASPLEVVHMLQSVLHSSRLGVLHEPSVQMTNLTQSIPSAGCEMLQACSHQSSWRSVAAAL